MPARRSTYDEALTLAPWVEALPDRCLQQQVTEALVARRTAVQAGGDPKLIQAGDRTLEQIEYGRVTGELACRKAASAIRKFDEAYMAGAKRVRRRAS